MDGDFRSYYILLLMCMLVGIGIISVSSVLADTQGDHATAPGYHPGLFTTGARVSIPAVVNTYEGEKSEQSADREQNISFSVYPGDLPTGKKPSLVGFVSAGNLRDPVSIFGKMAGTDQFQYLATVIPDEQGIFLWEIPEYCYGYSDFQVKNT